MDRSHSASDSGKQPLPLSIWLWTVLAATAICGAAAEFYSLGHKSGLDQGGEKYVAEVNALRTESARYAASEAFAEGNLASVEAQLKQWREAYHSLEAEQQRTSAENASLREQVKQLDVCGYLEHQIESLDAALRWNASSAIVERRDRIQEQLSTCRH